MLSPMQKPLTDDEIDEIVIAQVDDDDAWEEEITVTPVSGQRVARDAERRSRDLR
jgi:hypothetical protein